ncbi:MAG: DUF1853 family protein [Halopseudomonas sp.]
MPSTAGVTPTPYLPASGARLNQLQHPCVRDLAWCLNSPAIYRLGHDCRNLWGNTEALWHWLQQLDRHPQPLLDSISQQRSHRLGIYFETLFGFALTHYLKPAKNFYALAVRHRNRTVGEYDFLVRLQGEPALRHVEVSIKFYLGLPTADDHACWTGLNRNDRLTDKRDKMLYQQLRLSRQTAARQQLADLGEQIGPCHGVMMGRLFYPFAKPRLDPPTGAQSNHLRGWWIRQSELKQLIATADRRQAIASATLLVPLQRRQWLAPLSPLEAEQLASARQAMTETDQPGMRARLINTPRGWREHDRGIVVEDKWLDSVFEALE